ncbi:hypothetical protein [Streptomyces sp. Rer75]|uniref:hypothetical protein n=1 Tax=Streptomyces sp. Rer75 TaxID=2750011 RepID=UPI0015CFE1B5|nr:hypothetical protein [Streptomyces sp. Rer75]QLH26653.1 hypothetical protein HYQ63_43545 [Streptomyces sp. Rer75]
MDTALDAGQTSEPGPEGERVDLGEVEGRTWTMEPDPDNPGGYLVLADGTAVGTLTPRAHDARPPTARCGRCPKASARCCASRRSGSTCAVGT